MTPFPNDFSDNAAADPETNYNEYYKYQKVLAIVEYMKSLADGKTMSNGQIFKYDANLAPKFRFKGTAAPATTSGPATASMPATK